MGRVGDLGTEQSTNNLQATSLNLRHVHHKSALDSRTIFKFSYSCPTVRFYSKSF